ncbi:hypothetical protein [Poseidonibacter ostreae]|uniref:Lipoprotein n=1 Tax=Poseidonibacter ostreae TaxID=2654171 RepID=A0A6L4WTT9_9BACT|nr:hypothetical protein [Poseidonibacter ostreae]KAB7889571.1 hypothetical protein GBG19_05810 [Poseidonibacter ostreae]
MKNTVKIGVVGIVSTLLLSGCAVDKFAQKYSPENVKRMIAKKMNGKSESGFKIKFQDKDLANKFATYYDKDGYIFDYTSNTFNVQKQLVYFSQNVYLKNANSYIQNNSAENEFSKKYKETILERGNNYKILTGDFNKELIEVSMNRKVPNFRQSTKQYLKWNLIPVIAEFDSHNELKSIMLNRVEIGSAYDRYRDPNVQSEINLNILVYTGNALNTIKNNVSKKKWEDNLISSSN